MKDKLKQLLIGKPEARERRYRYHAIRAILVSAYPQLKEISKETMLQICRDMVKLDRELRKIQQDNPHLRGSDYEDKHELEAVAKEELGYKVSQQILL